MVAEGNLHERIATIREQTLWISATEMQDGSGGLSAKATEFVPGGRVSGLSPKATEYVPAEGGQNWGWSGNLNGWGPQVQDWGYYNVYGDAGVWQAPGVGAQGCLFNEDAYSTDSSRSSDSEPEEENDVVAAPEVPASEALPEASQALSEALPEALQEVDSDDSDEFNSFSEDEPELEVQGTQRSATQAPERPETHVPDSGPTYAISLLLRVRQAVAAAPCNGVGPRWSIQADQEQTPDWLRRRGESREALKGEENGTEWRSRAGEASKSRRRGQEVQKAEKVAEVRAPKLEVSETSWAAQVAKRKAVKASCDESFVKTMRAILNKLTVEKFDTLSDQIIELIAESERPNSGIPLLMQLIFEKATTQHHFINMYVSLCVKLHKWLMENMEMAESQSNFKRVLLNQCQSSFEQYLEPPEGFEGLTGDELYEAQVKYKTKMLGNIRLVGELIRHGMLAPKIAIAVATELAGDDPAVRGERLETLATFLETVGVALDDPSWKHHGELEVVFAEVERASADKSVPRRVRCLLQDVLDLRREGWSSSRRKELSKESPQTLAQVHEQAKADQAPSKKELIRSVSYR